MSGYNEIRGLRVKYLSADPANPENGQVWYNSTTGNLRVQGIGVGAFSSAAPLTTARNSAASFGTQTAGVIGLGGTPAGGSSAATEEYNGSGWSTGNNANTARRYLSGFGIETAGVACGGFIPAVSAATEEYDGSSWTAGGNLNTARYFLASAGILTAGVAFGGNVPPFTAATEEYNGTSWTNVNSMSTSRGYLAGTGIQTAALGFGGYAPGNTAATEEYDGTNWTAGGNLNTAKRNVSGGGTLSSGQAFGGFTTTSITSFEEYNGSTWSNSPLTLATARQGAGSLGQPGSQTANLITGGSGATSLTEEYNFSSSTVTAAAWSSGGNLSGLARNYNVGCGINTAGLSVGGFNPGSGALTLSEEYNGSTWANGGTLGTASYDSGVSGTQTAALKAGNLPGYPTATEEYDGSTWTAGGALSTGRAENAASGIQTASLAISGGLPPAGLTANVESYDGTSWTEGPNVNTARRGKPGGSGTSTAALFYGGYTNPPSPANMQSATESYDGTSWSEVNNLTEARFAGGPAQNGTQTSSLYAAGYTPANSASNTANGWDGTSWSTRPSMAQGVRHLGGAGSGNTSAMIFGGFNGTARVQSTEEFTGETVTVNPASNLTVS